MRGGGYRPCHWTPAAHFARHLRPERTERPGASAKLKQSEGGRTLEATIRANGLPATDYVHVRVNTLKWGEVTEEDVRQRRGFGEDLYWTDIGPNPKGEVDFSLEFPLPLGDYPMILIMALSARGRRTLTDAKGNEIPPCESHRSGCTIIQMPARSPLPQLSASWDIAAGTHPVLVVSLKAQDLLRVQATPQTTTSSASSSALAEEKIRLRVRASGTAHSPSEADLHWSVVTANSKGVVDISGITIPVSQSFSDACVTALLAPPSGSSTAPQAGRAACQADCQLTTDNEGVWLWLPVPEAMPTATPQ